LPNHVLCLHHKSNKHETTKRGKKLVSGTSLTYFSTFFLLLLGCKISIECACEWCAWKEQEKQKKLVNVRASWVCVRAHVHHAGRAFLSWNAAAHAAAG
jgi:hypothetical protein